MRRRTLLILALSLLLVIPAVMALAASGFDAPGTPAETADQVQEQARDCGDCLYGDPDRDQVRDRDQDRTNAPAVSGDRDQIQEQKQLRIHVPATGEVREQVQEQKQFRIHVPATGEVREQVQEQKQLRVHEPATGEVSEQVQTRERAQVRDETNCVGDEMHLREQVRTEERRELKLGEPQGEQKGFGPGAETGNGPQHESPADTGNQFGRGDR